MYKKGRKKPSLFHLHIQFMWNNNFKKVFCFAVVFVQSLSCVQLFVTPWTAACQAPLSSTISRVLLKFTSLSQWCYLLSNHLILYCPIHLLSSVFPSIRSFIVNRFFASGGQSIGVSASASVLPMNIQYWFPLGLTGLISLQSIILHILLSFLQIF